MFTTKFSTRIITFITILLLTLSSVEPALAAPSNDFFASATDIPSLPFDDTADTSGAIPDLEAGEQAPACTTGDGFSSSVWYRFTTTTRVSLTTMIDANIPVAVAFYTGNSLDNLTSIFDHCVGSSVTANFIVEPNTYYIHIGSWGFLTAGGTIHLHLETVPPPQAAFSFSPSDPSIFDNIQFDDRTPQSYRIDSFTWDFGDGANSTAEDPTHQYLTDGDYTVQHTITANSFTTSTSQVVQVRTHDVAITRVVAPSSARLGQTRPITVYIKNNRYEESVLLQLYKSNPNVAGGFELVGSYTQFVPVRSGNRTSAFTFNYTFTAADLSVGKVTFKAVATLVNGHDAIPSDNALSSAPPTVVKR